MTPGPLETALSRWGWDVGWAAAAGGAGAGVGETARVRRHVRAGLWVATARADDVYAAVAEGLARPEGGVAAGDWVVLGEPVPLPPKDGAPRSAPGITAVLPRRTALVRCDPVNRATPQALAANAPVTCLVQGADRPVNHRRWERALVVVHGGGSAPALVVTKADAHDAVPVARSLAKLAPQAPLLVTSAATGDGIPELAALGRDAGTIVLLGESGAGKSALVNALLGAQAVAVGAVRAGDRKGRHTTVRRELLALPGGGCVLDSPGVRAIGLWADDGGLDATFPEIAALVEGCRFADCRHVAEPDCAVRAASAAHEIAGHRMRAWRTLRAELEEVAAALTARTWRSRGGLPR